MLEFYYRINGKDQNIILYMYTETSTLFNSATKEAIWNNDGYKNNYT